MMKLPVHTVQIKDDWVACCHVSIYTDSTRFQWRMFNRLHNILPLALYTENSIHFVPNSYTFFQSTC
jgi:hypothetical protein